MNVKLYGRLILVKFDLKIISEGHSRSLVSLSMLDSYIHTLLKETTLNIYSSLTFKNNNQGHAWILVFFLNEK